MPRSYQVTPKVLGRRRATEAFVGQTNDDTKLWSQPAASPRTNRIRRTTNRLDPSDDDTDATLGIELVSTTLASRLNIYDRNSSFSDTPELA